MNNINYYKEPLYSRVVKYDTIRLNGEDEFVVLNEFVNGVILGNVLRLNLKFIAYSNGLDITPWFESENSIPRITRNGMRAYRRNFRV